VYLFKNNSLDIIHLNSMVPLALSSEVIGSHCRGNGWALHSEDWDLQLVLSLLAFKLIIQTV
jgi:hypothetical protein